MAEEKLYDVVVLGAGSGGLTAAVGFVKAGKRVLLVEREHLGGECTNNGCVPSKALLHHAKSYYEATGVAGDSATGRQYRDRAFEYVREKVAEFREEESSANFEALGIEVVMGEAEFIAPCVIQVGKQKYKYKRAVIATGSSPRLLDIPGVEKKDILTNQNIFDLASLPERVLIIGGGPIGMEMGQALAMLGTKVTIATVDELFAGREDRSVAQIVEKQFAKLGIQFLKNAHIERVENRQAILQIKHGDNVAKSERVAYDKLLLAIGRTPNLPKGLKSAHIIHDAKSIQTDGQYRTSNKHVYAIGDVTEKNKFTHTASDAGRQVVGHVLSYGWLRVNRKKAVPKVTYTNPEIAQVGLSYDEAASKYQPGEIVKIKVPYEDIDRAQTDSATNGVLVVIARRLNGTILGASLAGARAGELISIFTLAIDKKISLWSLRSLIYAYPTYSSIIQKAGDQFLQKQLKTWKSDLWFLVKKHLPKLVALIFWGALIYSFQHYRITNGLSYSDMLLSLYEFFTMSMWGPIIYIVLYTIRPLILFPATLLTALSGALFGFWWGIAYTIIGENLSANFAYWIGRFFGQGLRLEDSFLGNSITWLRNRPFEAVLFMRLFYVPFDLANYGSGVLKVGWPSYALATFIGIIPGLTTFVALGAAIDVMELRMDGLTFDAFDPKYIALSVAIFVTSIVLVRFLKRWKAEN